MSREVPEGWQLKSLGEVMDFQNGFAFKPADWCSSGLPIVRIQNLNGGGDFNFYDGYVPPQFGIKSGDILFCWSGSRGTSFGPRRWKGGEGWLNQHIFRCDLKPDIDDGFAFYLLEHLTEAIEQAAHGGAGLVHIKKSELIKFQAMMPPPHEQRRIAEILSSVDEAVVATRAVIEQSRKVKQGVLERLLTKGIGHTRFKHTEIGEIPEGWEVGPLSRFGKVYTGKTPSTSDDEAWGGDTPFVTPGDLSDDRAIIGDSSRYVSEQGTRQGRVMPAGAVAVTCIGSTIGKTGILNEPSMTNQQINTICCREEVSLFVYETCISLRSHLQRISGKQAVPIVNKSTFENIVVAHPKLEEQIEISRVALEFEMNLQTQLNNLKRLSLLKTALMSDLLTGRKRVTDALPLAAE